MLTEIQTAYAATKAALGVVSSLQKISTDTKINEAVFEIQRGLLDAQAAVMDANARISELTEEKSKLEKELIEIKDWRKESSRYELEEVAPGILFYSLKKNEQSTEPAHYLCPQCFVNNKKSFLQKPTISSTGYKCHQCRFEARTHSARIPRIDQSLPDLQR